MKKIFLLCLLITIGCSKSENREHPLGKKMIKPQGTSFSKKVENMRKIAPSVYKKDSSVFMPELTRLTGQELQRAKKVLTKQGKKAVPALIKGLKAKNKLMRVNSIGVLAEIGLQAKDALPALFLIATEDKIIQARSMAFYAIGKIGVYSQKVEEVMKSGFNSKLDLVRWEAVRAAGNFGKKGVPLKPDLERLLIDKDRWVKLASSVSLYKIEKNDKEFASRLIERFKNPEEKYRKNIIVTIKNVSPKNRFMIPLLMDLLKNKNHFYKRVATRLLGNMGKDAKIALPLLKICTKDKDYSTSKYAKDAILKINGADNVK
jgi:HEAT repeat protein